MKVLVSAAEPSGDAIGAQLVDGFRRCLEKVELAGAAGPRMASRGVAELADAADFAHAGWSSVAVRLPWLAWKAWCYFRAVERFAPDRALVVDAPGLHAPLVRRLRRRGVPVGWVAPPQLWAWKDRSPAVLRDLPVYPAHRFELGALARAGARAFWWGYPGIRPAPTFAAAPPDLLAVLPGSRPAWRRRHLGPFVAAARAAGLPLEIALVHPHPSADRTEAGLVCLEPAEALPRAALAISLPGTATLETALRGVPTVVAARPGRLDLWMARRNLSDGARALPNRILGETVFPELYGDRASVEALAGALKGLFLSREAATARLDGLRDKLGSEEAPRSIVRHFLEN